MKKTISEELVFPVEFYDEDRMNVVWHGNYVRYMEKARCALLNKIGYNYLDMAASGYAFPVVTMSFKFVKSLHFGQKVRAVATLVDYENSLRIRYEFYNAETGELTTKAESNQMAVEHATGKSRFLCPDELIRKVKALLGEED